MADSYASVSEVAALMASVNIAANRFENSAVGEAHVARRNLQFEARKLLASLEEPNLNVWPHIFQVRSQVL